MSEVIKEIYCLGVQRAATTSIYEDIAEALDLPHFEVKEKSSLFEGDNIPEGAYLKSHSGYRKSKYFLDFTPEYSIHLDKIKIPKNAFVFVVLRKPSSRIISHWKKYRNERKQVTLEEFIDNNIDRCVDRSRYSKFLPLLLKDNCKVYFLERDLKKLYNDLSRYLGCEIKQSVKANSSVKIPRFFLPLYRYLAIENAGVQKVLTIIGFKKLYRLMIRPLFQERESIKISNKSLEILNLINQEEKLALKRNSLVIPW